MLSIYVQSPDHAQVASLRKVAAEAGVLGTRLFVAQGELSHLHLADNLADIVVVNAARVPADELLRVLRPGGRSLVGAVEVVKPVPESSDDWSHPYHGPDNNPQSKDQLARART